MASDTDTDTDKRRDKDPAGPGAKTSSSDTTLEAPAVPPPPPAPDQAKQSAAREPADDQPAPPQAPERPPAVASDVKATDSSAEEIRLLPDSEIDSFEQRWREVQLLFVDDPKGAASGAEALTTEVIDQVSTALTARKRKLDSWSNNGDSTEEMLQAVREYRQLLDHVLDIDRALSGDHATAPGRVV